MFSHLAAIVLAATAFGMLASASPITDLVARGTQLDAVLSLLADLQVKIAAIIAVYVKLDVQADISVYIAQIVVLVNACVTALVSIGAIVDLSDVTTITAIAKVCATIILDIQASITVFASILVNVVAVASLDVALKLWIVQLNLCISGFIVIVAPLCVQLTAYVNLVLTAVIAVLGLA